MSNNAACAKCNRPPKGASGSVVCPNPKCGNLFHTGCLKIYITYEAAGKCCKDLFKFLESQGAYINAVPGGSRKGSRSALAQSANVNNASSIAVDLAALQTVEIPEETETDSLPAGWAEMSEKQRSDRIMESLMGIHRGVNETRSALVSIAPVFNAHTRILHSHESRISSIEKKSTATPAQTSELIIDNLPSDCYATRDPTDIVKRVLSLMNLSNLESDILNVREFKRNQAKGILSLSVFFKSNFIRDHVINIKRKFGVLKLSQVFDEDSGDETVYINELLPLETYRLYMAAKEHKTKTKWEGCLWIQGGRILARKGSDKSEKVFEIRSMADLPLLS